MYQNISTVPAPSDKVVYVGVPPKTIPCFPLIKSLTYCVSESKHFNGKWHVRLVGHSIRIGSKENVWLPSRDFRLVSGSSHADHPKP